MILEGMAVRGTEEGMQQDHMMVERCVWEEGDEERWKKEARWSETECG